MVLPAKKLLGGTMNKQHADVKESANPNGLIVWLTKNGVTGVGVVLIAAHLGLLLGTLARWPGFGSELRQTLSDVHQITGAFTLVLGAACLCVGELVRRRQLPHTSPDDEFIEHWTPRTTNVRMLPLRWHVIWAVIAIAVAAVLIRLLHDNVYSPQAGHAAASGTLVAAIAGAVIASGSKKLSWLRAGEAKQRVLKNTFYTSARRSQHFKQAKFWGWFSGRFFLDLWCVGVGFALWWIAASLAAVEGVFDAPPHGAIIILTAAGLALVTFGLWATTQFYRSGMDLGTGEYLG